MLAEFLNANLAMLWQGCLETLYMTALSTLFAYLVGLPLGVLLIITAKNGIRPMKTIHDLLSWLINIGRSIPFIILMVALMPFTQFVTGKMIGTTATVVPLVIAAAPFIARLVESSVEELDRGVIEAAKTMGATNWQIIYKVILPETIPSLIRGASITTITLIGYSAMAGALGGGGLGDIAIRYGYNRYQNDVMFATIIILIIIVQIVQYLFHLSAKKIDKRNK